MKARNHKKRNFNDHTRYHGKKNRGRNEGVRQNRSRRADDAGSESSGVDWRRKLGFSSTSASRFSSLQRDEGRRPTKKERKVTHNRTRYPNMEGHGRYSNDGAKHGTSCRRERHGRNVIVNVNIVVNKDDDDVGDAGENGEVFRRREVVHRVEKALDDSVARYCRDYCGCGCRLS